MKKNILYLFMAVAGLFMASCEKDEIGGTATQNLAGEWYVTVVAVDDDDNLLYSDEDLYDIGTFEILTYNTAGNTDSLWIDDLGNFWEFKVKTLVDLNNSTFATPTQAANYYYDSKVLITNGRILYGAATTPSGMPADSIVFNVLFDDDSYVQAGYWAKYRIAGYRRTGFVNDEP
jgi:hypothetical protein